PHWYAGSDDARHARIGDAAYLRVHRPCAPRAGRSERAQLRPRRGSRAGECLSPLSGRDDGGTVTPAALAKLAALPAEPLFGGPTPLDEAIRLRAALGPAAPRIFIKRDDAIPFGFGGNKVRKLCLVAADARARGADTLITVGGVQSNHMRATASTAVRLGMRCVLVANGTPPEPLRANALLDALLGAELHYVSSREERAPTMQ